MIRQRSDITRPLPRTYIRHRRPSEWAGFPCRPICLRKRAIWLSMARSKPRELVVVGQRDQLIAREHLVGMTHKGCQESNLLLAQRQGFSIDRYAPDGLIQCDVVARQNLLNSAFGATQHGVGAGNDFAGIEWLDDVVVGAALQSDDSIGVGFPGGEHDDWYVRLSTQDPAHLNAIETRQHQIEDDQVRSQGTGQRQPGFSIVRNLGGVSRALEIHLEPTRDPRIVFDYQYGGAHRWFSRHSSWTRHLMPAPRLSTRYVHGPTLPS